MGREIRWRKDTESKKRKLGESTTLDRVVDSGEGGHGGSAGSSESSNNRDRELSKQVSKAKESKAKKENRIAESKSPSSRNK